MCTTLARCVLCLAIAMLTCGWNFFAAHAANAEVQSSGSITKIKLAAYPIAADGDNTWNVEAGPTDEITENGGRLRICVGAVFADGTKVQEYQSESWGNISAVGDGFNYVWEGDCVTVDSMGVITALDDGETTITVTPKNESISSLSANITIKTLNQGVGYIVTNLSVVDAKGNAYGDETLKLDDESSSEKLYARVKYRDKKTGESKTLTNYPGASKAQTPQDGELNDLVWTVSDGEYASATKQSGGACLVKAIASGTVQIRCAISGGDASEDGGMGPGIVYDAINVKIANGKTINGGVPSSKLKVNVVYEKDQSKIAITKTYTKGELEALGAVTRRYTLTQGGGKYVTDEAYGVPFAVLLQTLNLDVNDILYFTFSANDGANPGKISAKWLLKTTRYYLPNYDIGGSWQEKEQTPTMIALKDSWSSNSMETGELNSGTCFRLVFGSATNNDNATSKSLKFINTITVVMDGAPPSSHGDNKKADDKKADNPEKKKNEGNGGSGASGQGGGGNGNAGVSNGGQGMGKTEDTSQARGEGAGKTATKVQKLDDDVAWSIYEMMNKSNSDVPVEYEDNWIVPYVSAGAVALLLAAGVIRYLAFRRRITKVL